VRAAIVQLLQERQSILRDILDDRDSLRHLARLIVTISL
jgi:hypothetical protein